MKPGGTLQRRTPMARGTSTLSRGQGIARVAKPAAGPKTRKCKHCRSNYLPDPKRPWKTFCSDECALHIALAELAKQKAKKQQAERAKAKAERVKDRAALEQLKTRNELIAEAQAAFNLVVRLEDAALPCISCGTMNPPKSYTGGQWDAGHYLSRGSSCHLRFDRRNVHKQCKGCNRPGGCTRDEHRRGVEARIGREALEALESDQDSRDYTKDDLRAIRDTNRKRAAQLKKELACNP